MTIVLAVLVVLLLLERQIAARQNARERKQLLNAVVARDAPELALLQREPKPKHESKFDVEHFDFPAGL